MDAILLAAGNSVRFGGNKLLHYLDEKPMYRHVLELLYDLKADYILDHVVVVSQYDEIFEDVRTNFPGVETVRNPTPELGISGSIRLGIDRLEQIWADKDVVKPEDDRSASLENMSGKPSGCLFAVADQPCLSRESLVRLIQLWEESSCGIATASHEDWIGNPVIFDTKYLDELKRLTGDVGGKKVLRRHMDDTVLCEVPECELEDLDTRDAVSKFHQGRKMPERNRQEEMGQKSEQDQKAEFCDENDQEKLFHSFPFLKEKGHIISIVGGGGKTTLMYTLANCYAEKGMRVVATTTTHIRRPDDYPVAESREELERLLREHPVVVAGVSAPGNKLRMPDGVDRTDARTVQRGEAAPGNKLKMPDGASGTDACTVQIGETAPGNKRKPANCMCVSDYAALADVVLIEADGAKCLPCKVPAEKEPVIPDECDIVIGVMGIDTLGQPLEEICFRRELAMELLNVEEEHRMTAEDMAEILASDRGTRKGVGNRDYYVVLNKCDDKQRMRQGEKIRELLARVGIEKIVCISLREFADTGK